MKSLTMAMLAAVLGASAWAMPATPAGFTDDLEDAIRSAKASDRRVMAVFSGSDWCSWCIRLEREVLSKRSFVAAVSNELVLAFVDMPQDRSLLSDRARAANPQLIRRYGIQGFPTVLILDGDGKVVSSTGYRRGGSAAYAAHLKGILAGLGPVATNRVAAASGAVTNGAAPKAASPAAAKCVP